MKFLRYRDLVEAGIVRNRATLGRWIKNYGFPPGFLLGPNTRVWPANQVDQFLAKRRHQTEQAGNHACLGAQPHDAADESISGGRAKKMAR